MLLLRNLPRLALVTFVTLTASLGQAHTFDETGLLGDQLQVKLMPKYSSGSLIGIEVMNCGLMLRSVTHSFRSAPTIDSTRDA